MKWRVRVDTGGTFTDAWGVDPEGMEVRCKVLSDGSWVGRVLRGEGRVLVVEGLDDLRSGGFVGLVDERLGRVVCATGGGLEFSKWDGVDLPDRVELRSGEEAPVLAARILTGTGFPGRLPEMDFRVATTRGTNALLEGKGARLLLLVTRGFEDLLEIRDQRRKSLFALEQPEEANLAERVRGIAGRLSATGEVVEEVDEEEVRGLAREALADGLEVAAVSLMHAWRDAGMEERVAGWLRDEGFGEVRISSDTPMMKYLTRTDTVVVDAWLAPVIGGFTASVAGAMSGGEPLMMTSAGGLVAAGRYAAKDSLFSGPAGGLVGAAEVAKAAGFPKIITFDMGGTSTDVARIDGAFRYRHEQVIGDGRVMAPALRMETVAAGGGSICQWRMGRLEVGPESAGAMPGPACYGRGGPLTMTDVNLLLGLMEVEGAGIPLSREAAYEAFCEVYAGGGGVPEKGRELGEDELEFLRGLRRIGVEAMAAAIRGVSVREGHDPRDFALFAFGGAGPQHACDVADALGISTVLVPGDAGLLSAWGLEKARRQVVRVRQVLKPLGEVENLRLEVEDGEGDDWTYVDRHFTGLRLKGQGAEVEVEVCAGDTHEEVYANFANEYFKLYGYAADEARGVECVSLRVVREEAGMGTRDEVFEGGKVSGPKVLQDRFSTCVVGAGWVLERGNKRTLLLTRTEGDTIGAVDESVQFGAIRAALFRSRLEGAVGEMGELLQRTAVSTNVRERLDFSCAFLDARGKLVVNAPHVPVHLGALGVCVREVLEELEIRRGDVVVTNHPGYGGSHLPDVTMIAGVFAGDDCVGYVANRAHHAEMGGMAPGSMPAGAEFLEEEGVVISPMYWRRGDSREGVSRLRDLLEGGLYPSRRVAENMADLEAQESAIAHGIRSISALVESYGVEVVEEMVSGILDQSAMIMGGLLKDFGDREISREEELDDGSKLVVGLRFADGELLVDFTGTSGVHPGNLNATPAIVRSVVLYVLRVWVGVDVPLNEGLLEKVRIVCPEGSMLNPKPKAGGGFPAVVGGNVEVSQRLTDLLFAALGLSAHGPGTMNNFLFGNGGDGYYETIGGGAGATEGACGVSGKHVHMTNTAITDAEVLEHRFPLRLHEFALRRGSGGRGGRRGGDGLIREVEFLEAMTVSFLCERRLSVPEGLCGGESGKAGAQFRIFEDGREEELGGRVTVEIGGRERVRILTPGGGGYGRFQE